MFIAEMAMLSSLKNDIIILIIIKGTLIDKTMIIMQNLN